MTDLAIQEIARAMWQEESHRVLGKARLIPWEEENPQTRAKWCGIAQAAYTVARKHIEADVVAWLWELSDRQTRLSGNTDFSPDVRKIYKTEAKVLAELARRIERGDYRQEEQS